MASGNTAKIIVFNEDTDETVLELESPTSVDLGQFKRIRELFAEEGYSVRINGELASPTDTRLTGIVNRLNSEGISVIVDGAVANDTTPLRNGSVISAAGSVKGN